MKKLLTNEDFEQAALKIGCETEVIKAVAKVESLGKGFNRDGSPIILFEGHVFWRELKRKGIDPVKHTKGNEDILYVRWTRKHYTGNYIGEYKRLKRAFEIDKEAALKSTSWGMFQIMGFNFGLCGYSDVFLFVMAMEFNSVNQLNAFVNFVINRKIAPHLQTKNWRMIAALYNGSGYAKNQYHTKMRNAYLKLKS